MWHLFLAFSKISGWAKLFFHFLAFWTKSTLEKRSVFQAVRKVVWRHRGSSLGGWVKGAPQGWSPGTSPWGCSRARTRTCPSHFPGERLRLFSQGLLKWGHYDVTFQNFFLLYKSVYVKPSRGVSWALTQLRILLIRLHELFSLLLWLDKCLVIFTKQSPTLWSKFWNTW